MEELIFYLDEQEESIDQREMQKGITDLSKKLKKLNGKFQSLAAVMKKKGHIWDLIKL